MRIIVTHSSPDIDAITAVWLLKRFLPGWEEAQVKFVPAGERIANSKLQIANSKNPIEKIGQNEVVHVDTGDGPLDHHLTTDESVSAASLTLNFIKQTLKSQQLTIHNEKLEAIERIVKVVVEIDHFKEVFWKEPLALYHDFSLSGILDGLKFQRPNEDSFYVEFISQCLDALLHDFENRIWAEKEIAEKGQIFETRFGKGLGVETINDSVIKLGQKMGFSIVVRKDPRKGYLRIKALPKLRGQKDIDLTLVYEKLKKMDPQASWFLHVSKKMLLNGSPKNPKMRPTVLSLNDIIKVLKSI